MVVECTQQIQRLEVQNVSCRLDVVFNCSKCSPHVIDKRGITIICCVACVRHKSFHGRCGHRDVHNLHLIIVLLYHSIGLQLYACFNWILLAISLVSSRPWDKCKNIIWIKPSNCHSSYSFSYVSLYYEISALFIGHGYNSLTQPNNNLRSQDISSYPVWPDSTNSSWHQNKSFKAHTISCSSLW